MTIEPVSAALSADRDVLALAVDLPLSAAEAAYVEAACAENTLRGYRSDWAEFTTWCDRAARPALPAAGDTISTYLTELARRGAKVGTMRRRLSSIRFAHQLRDLPDHTTGALRWLYQVPEVLFEGASTPQPPLATLVSAVFDALVHDLHRLLPQAGFPDIRPAHCTGVFRVIDPEGTRPSELARRAGITAQGIAEAVSYLESRGYLTRVPDLDDRRGRIVLLTERGRLAAQAAADAFAATEARWREHLGAARIAEFRQTLTDLSRLEN